MRYLVFFLSLLLMPVCANGQTDLFGGLIRTKGYVVGAKLSASGLHQMIGDTTWNHIGLNHPQLKGIAADPMHPDTLYLACGNGILRSYDGGTHWRITTGWEVTEVQDVAVDPTDPAQIYAASSYGVWRSADRGETWVEATGGLPKKYTQVVKVDAEGHVLIGTEGGVYRSIDKGVTWQSVGPKDVHILALAQSAAQPNRWIAGTQKQGVLLSYDGGNTWNRVGGNMANAHIYSVSFHPTTPDRIVAGGWDTGLMMSTNGGKKWKRYTKGLPVPHLYQVLFDAYTPDRLWVATVEAGLFRSDDFGAHWEYAGLDGTLIFELTHLRR